MPSKIDLLQEAYKRGILPDSKKPLYEEAVRRGLIGQPELPGSYEEMSQEAVSQYNAPEADRGQELPGDYTEPMSTAAGDLGILPHKTGYELGESALKSVVRPAVEGTATLAGSVYGSPALGGAMGYAASNQLMDLVEDYYAQKVGGKEPEQRTYGGEMMKVGTDVATIATTGKMFELAGPALEKTADVLFDTLPKRMTASALKMPLSKKWVKTLPGKEISKRTAAAEEVLKSDIPHTKFGLQKAKSLADEVHTFIDDTTDILSKDPSNNIKFNKAIAKGLKSAYKKASTSSNIPEAKALVDKVKTDLRKMRGIELTPKEANALKRTLWDEVQWFKEGLDPVVEKSKKGVAHQLMKELETIYPAITSANETLAARMGVVEALEMSLAKSANKDLLPLGAKVLAAGTHPGMATAETLFSFPNVKTSVARFLAKGNPKKYSKFIYPEKPLGYTPPVKEIESEVYRYMPKVEYVKSTIPQTPKTTLRPAEARATIKTKADTRKEIETNQIRKAIDAAFERQAYEKTLTGPGLKKPTVEYTKSTTPSIKTTLRPAEVKKEIKNVVAERIEKEEAIRLKHLEMQFKKQAQGKGLVGPPLKKPAMEYTKTEQPMSVEQRLKQWGK